MAKCIKCGKGAGFFKKYYTRADHGPFCKECIRLCWALENLYLDQVRKAAEGEPQAAAWVALCHLTCAERVNLIRGSKQASGVALASDVTWRASKEKALEYVQIALDFLPSDAAGRALVGALEERAAAVEAPTGAEICSTDSSASAAPVFPHYTHSLEDWAIFSGEVSLDDLMDVSSTLTGHEWLGREAVDQALRQAKIR